jgi:cation diffusion facilitator CzcD-associated flavoprotein CzcO
VGRRVLVAGLGNSGADIAVELYRGGAEVAVSAPRGAWIVPKYLGGIPYDYHLTNMSLRQSIQSVDTSFEELVLLEHARNGIDIERFKMRLAPKPLDLFRSRMTFNSDIAGLIDAGEIRILSQGEVIKDGEFRDTSGQCFKFDAIIAATGYQRHFPFLDAVCQPHDRGALTLYKHVFHPRVPGLAFLGACGVVGAIFPVVEMQARWVASCFVGGASLPDVDVMVEVVETHNEESLLKRIKPSRVVQVHYMEALAEELKLGSLERRRASLRSEVDPVIADMY